MAQASRLLRKPVRSASGVVVVAVMSSPALCPHGRCVYCPRVPGVPPSYTGREPSGMRGLQHGYDPYAQVETRLRQLGEAGHPTEKVELIIQGGTFTARPLEYQRWFVKRCLDAVNGVEAGDLEEAKRLAWSAGRRCVSLTVETRPDWCLEPQIDLMLSYGTTRIEIGVQTVHDSVLESVKRGHTLRETVESFRVAKDAGLKVVAHMMPGLPGVTREMDLEAFKTLYASESFKPDMVKIYPTLVLEGTELYEMMVGGEYTPLCDAEAAELVASIKEVTPPWVRIMRVQRDIPAPLIRGGVRKSNLRELAQSLLTSRGGRCRCIRCREVGIRRLRGGLAGGMEPVLESMDYRASGGEEVFLQFVDKPTDTLFAYLRLRAPSPRAHRPEVRDGACIVRELRSLGSSLPLGARNMDSWQHRGLGRRLMLEAERVAGERFDAEKLLVTSAIGTREYYARLGYRPEGPYMAKVLGG